MEKSKHIRGMDEKVWNQFVGFCKTQGKNVSEVLIDIITKVVGKNNDKK